MNNPIWPAHPAEKAGSYKLHPVMAQCLAPFAPPNSSVHRQAPRLSSFKATLGENIAVEVFYEHTPAEAPVYNVDSPVCGPGHDAEVEICEVILNGEDVHELLADSVIESFEQQAWKRVAA